MKITRKQIFIVAAVLLLALAGTVVYYYLRSREPREGSLELAPYSCVWEKQGRGTICLTVSGELPEDARWSMMSSGSVEAVQQEGGAVFTVTVRDEGRGSLFLQLRENDLPMERGANFEFSFTADGKKRLSLDSGVVRVIEGASRTLDSGLSVWYRQSSAGSVFVYVNGNSWQVDTSEGLLVIGPTVDGDTTRMEIYAEGSAEQRSLTLLDRSGAGGIELSFSEKDGVLVLADCRAVSADSAASPENAAESDTENDSPGTGTGEESGSTGEEDNEQQPDAEGNETGN